MIKYSKFSFWFSIFGFVLLLATLANYFGFYHYVYENDPTKLSFFILFIFFISSIFAGYQSTKSPFNPKVTEKLWFSAQAMLSLGMIGTVIGFLIMLGNAFSELDISSTQSAQNALKEIGTGMATALLTTLFGMSCALMLQIQLLVIEHE